MAHIKHILGEKNPHWGNLTKGSETEKGSQFHQIRNWRDPLWFSNVGLIAFNRGSTTLDCEVLTAINLSAEKAGKKQIYLGGFKNPQSAMDLNGPRFGAVREFWEETGLCPDLSIEEVEEMPRIVVLDAPTVGEVRREGKTLTLTNSPTRELAYKHPISLTIFATDAEMSQEGQLGGEVKDVQWEKLGDILHEHGSSRNFSYHAVLFGFIRWLETGEELNYSNRPEKIYQHLLR